MTVQERLRQLISILLPDESTVTFTRVDLIRCSTAKPIRSPHLIET
jgi:hypothetical protein